MPAQWTMTSGAYRMPPASAAVPPVTLLLDAYPSANFAYGFRKLRTAYAGSAVRIRRDSDNGELDVGFVGQDFDAAAAAAHIGGGSGFITTWYDQSGNGSDVIQAGALAQPTYVASGINALPTMSFGAGLYLQTSGTKQNTYFGSTTQGTGFAVVRPTTGSVVVAYWADGGNDNDRWSFQMNDDNTPRHDFGNAPDTVTGTVNMLAEHIWEFYRDASNNQSIVMDGTSLVSTVKTNALSAAGTPSVFTVGTYTPAPGSFTYKGQLSELVWWGTDLGTTDRAGARTNINTYYTVF